MENASLSLCESSNMHSAVHWLVFAEGIFILLCCINFSDITPTFHRTGNLRNLMTECIVSPSSLVHDQHVLHFAWLLQCGVRAAIRLRPLQWYISPTYSVQSSANCSFKRRHAHHLHSSCCLELYVSIWAASKTCESLLYDFISFKHLSLSCSIHYGGSGMK